MERYYETFGATWERQAYIKAAALDTESPLGKQFLSMMTPFVYRKSLDDQAVNEILAIRARRLQELNRKSSDEVNIKLDAGGIRDIEFYVQSLQLLYGGKIEILRTKSTLKTLEHLKQNKIIAAKDAAALTQAYLLLRRVESCLQMDNEAQTHILSANPTLLQQTACRMGWGRHDGAAEKLWNEVAQTRSVVLDLCLEVCRVKDT
jgi:glutamate-ammonia-ligase adenylyltransferase